MDQDQFARSCSTPGAPARARSTLSSRSQLREAIRSGRLAAGSRLPATRALARRARRLARRRRRGLRAARRRGLPRRAARAPRTRVAAAPAAAAAPRPPPARPAGRPATTSRPGTPDLATVPARGLGARPLRRALRELPGRRARLRRPARARRSCARRSPRYLGRVRGVAGDAASASSSAPAWPQALALVGRACVARGARRDRRRGPVALRHARAARPRRAASSCRSRSTPTGIDVDGARGRRPGRRARRAGPPVPDRRRARAGAAAALVAWARAHRRDRDRGRLRRRVPLRPRARSARCRGSRRSASSTRARSRKTLAPGLRLGWAGRCRPRWSSGVSPTRSAVATSASPVLEQLALADFLERGELDRHLRRTRPVYRAPPRRAARRAGRGATGPVGRGHRGGPARARCGCPAAPTRRPWWRRRAAARGGGRTASASTSSAAPRAPALLLGYTRESEPALRAAAAELAAAVGDTE